MVEVHMLTAKAKYVLDVLRSTAAFLGCTGLEAGSSQALRHGLMLYVLCFMAFRPLAGVSR